MDGPKGKGSGEMNMAKETKCTGSRYRRHRNKNFCDYSQCIAQKSVKQIFLYGLTVVFYRLS